MYDHFLPYHLDKSERKTAIVKENLFSQEGIKIKSLMYENNNIRAPILFLCLSCLMAPNLHDGNISDRKLKSLH